jgi:hypothetical protein
MARVENIFWSTVFKGPVTVASATTLTVNGSLVAASVGPNTLTVAGVTTTNSLLKVSGETQVKSLYQGITAIASGDTTKVVSTTGVNSASRIFLGLMPTVIASHKDLRTSVLSITENTSFTVQVDKATSDSQNVSWWVIEAQ